MSPCFNTMYCIEAKEVTQAMLGYIKAQRKLNGSVRIVYREMDGEKKRLRGILGCCVRFLKIERLSKESLYGRMLGGRRSNEAYLELKENEEIIRL